MFRSSLQLEKGFHVYTSGQLFKGDMVQCSSHCTAYVNVGRKKRRSGFMHTSSILSTLILVATARVSTMQMKLPNHTITTIKCTNNDDKKL